MSWFSRLVKPFTPKGPPTVNVIRFQGVIGGRGPRSLTFQNLDKVILKAFTAGVHPPEAVALAVNSPGGSPVQSALIGERIRTLAGRTKIPVLGFAEDVAASGGYWLLASADEIYADHSSIVGSVGVVSGGFGLPELIRRLGVERRLYTAGEKKAALDPFKPVKPEEVQKIKETLAQIHHVFKSYVKERRGSKLNEECLNGDFFVGEQGLKLGLVDKMGLMQPVLRERFGDDVKIQVVNPPRLPFPWSLGGGQDSSLSWPSSEALVASVLDELQDRADEHVLRSRFGL